MRLRGGSVVTGLSVSVKVTNVVTGSTLLSTTAMTEITPGVYVYNWSHGQSLFTECVATYVVGGSSYLENFTIDEALDKEESLAARAT
jgi:hypothetical protein